MHHLPTEERVSRSQCRREENSNILQLQGRPVNTCRRLRLLRQAEHKHECKNRESLVMKSTLRRLLCFVEDEHQVQGV